MVRGTEVTAYYNENDPYAAQWLRNLIAAGHIAPGEVDERSILDVRPNDLTGFRQCHFFAGIGVWSHALRLAGWPDDREVWTGSCPCQPFSAAGARKGFEDARHLYPTWGSLISKRTPSVVFGEQVASSDGYKWLDVVHSHLEALGYAVGPLVLPSAGFGAPHGRHRIFFVADAMQSRWTERWPESGYRSPAGGGCSSGVEYTHVPCKYEGAPSREQPLRNERSASVGPLEHAESEQARISRLAWERRAVGGHWGNADWIPCRGGKWRPIEPGTFPLAPGIANRMDKLRAYGNAINAPQAAEFISAFLR